MFHTYVTASCGNQVDIDRARWLMDDEIFHTVHQTAIKNVSPVGYSPFDIDMAQRMDVKNRPLPQRVWEAYCIKHELKYGNPFEPDVNPLWDR